ncbi:hypothetical protein V3N99_21835 [Dermatophilaceae bacterium Soc4.6]
MGPQVVRRALAWRVEAATPETRRRLNATQASASQAALASNFRGGAWARAPVYSSAFDLLDDGVVAVGLVRGDSG